MANNDKTPFGATLTNTHDYTDDGSDPGNCAVCHFFHTDKRLSDGSRPWGATLTNVRQSDKAHSTPYPDGLTHFASDASVHRGAQDVCQECATWELGNR